MAQCPARDYMPTLLNQPFRRPGSADYALPFGRAREPLAAQTRTRPLPAYDSHTCHYMRVPNSMTPQRGEAMRTNTGTHYQPQELIEAVGVVRNPCCRFHANIFLFLSGRHGMHLLLGPRKIG